MKNNGALRLTTKDFILIGGSSNSYCPFRMIENAIGSFGQWNIFARNARSRHRLAEAQCIIYRCFERLPVADGDTCRNMLLSMIAASHEAHSVADTAVSAVAEELPHAMNDLAVFMEGVVYAAKEAVANTPKLMQVLREARIVDARGRGLSVILDGTLQYLNGGQAPSPKDLPRVIRIAKDAPAARVPPHLSGSDGTSYGYCTEFLLRGKDLKPGEIKAAFENRGESLVVAGNHITVRVHIHTASPSTVLRLAECFGLIDQISIRDKDRQHEDYRQSKKERISENTVVVIAVTPGVCLAGVFQSLGPAKVIAVPARTIPQGYLPWTLSILKQILRGMPVLWRKR